MEQQSQLDLFQEEDASLLNLSRDVDSLITDMRKSVLDAVQTIRQRINAQCMDILDQERRDRREHERRLLAQIENLQLVLKERDNELAKQRLINERLIERSRRQHTTGYTKKLAKEALRQWRQVVVQGRYRKLLCDHLKQTRQERDARQFFYAWRTEANRQKFEETKEKLDGDHRRAVAKLNAEHHTSENRMQLEMLNMKEQLQKEEEHRAILEERLKAAFMRGVCALNMEAMTVLRNTSDANVDQHSVASLIQNLNLSAGVDSTTFSNEPGTTDRMFRQQQDLQEQLNRHRDAQPHVEVVEEEPPAPFQATAAPAATRRPPTGAQYPAVSSARGQSSSSHPVVQLNPNYPGSRPESSVAAAKPASRPASVGTGAVRSATGPARRK